MRLKSLFLVIAACGLLYCGCWKNFSWSGEDRNDPPITSSNVTVNVRQVHSYAEADCNATITYEMTPINLSQSGNGKTGMQTGEVAGPGSSPQPEGQYKHVCYYRNSWYGVQPGLWRISVKDAVNWSASCEVQIDLGASIVNFTVGRAGCKVGSPTSYPE